MTSKWVVVHTDKEKALSEVRDLNHWPEWNLLLDGAQQLNIKQNTAITDTGSRIEWNDIAGKANSIKVTGSNEKGLVTDLQFGDQRPMVSGFSIEKRQQDSVQVVWYIIETLRWYPWEKFYGMMAGDMKGPLMEKSLATLKRRLENVQR